MSQKCRVRTIAQAMWLRPLAAAGLTLMLGAGAWGQGILTVTPGRTATTAAGTGTTGYSGDGSAATSATLALPAAVAYDSSGNLYIADTNNHVIREVAATSRNALATKP